MLEDVKNYFANFNGTTNACRTVALWVTIALVLAFVATKVFVAVTVKRRGCDTAVEAAATKMLNGSWIVVALIAALALIITFAACYFTEVANGDDYLMPILFYPLLVFVLAAIGCCAALFFKPTKPTKIISAAVCGSALVAVIVCMIVYYASGDAAENNGGDVLSNIGLYLSAVLLAAGIVVAAVLIDRNSKPFDTRTVTFAAVCVAMSFALSYVRVVKMPMGGSITFASMLPLMLFAFMFGSRKGVMAGLVYGVLQAIQDPWIIHPAQFALDYAVAFAAIGLTGCIRELGAFKNNMRAQFALGATVACVLRFLSHYFAGVFAFGMYGASFAEQYGISALANPYFYSFVYQCLYIVPELIIVIVVGMLVFASKNFRKQISTYVERNSKSAPEPVPAAE